VTLGSLLGILWQELEISICEEMVASIHQRLSGGRQENKAVYAQHLGCIACHAMIAKNVEVVPCYDLNCFIDVRC
jgi:hypothetical protein